MSRISLTTPSARMSSTTSYSGGLMPNIRTSGSCPRPYEGYNKNAIINGYDNDYSPHPSLMNPHMIHRVVKQPAKPKSIMIFKGLEYDMESKSLKNGRVSIDMDDHTPKTDKIQRTVFQAASGARRIRHRRSVVDPQPIMANQSPARPLRRGYDNISNGGGGANSPMCNGKSVHHGSMQSLNSIATSGCTYDPSEMNDHPKPRKSVFGRPRELGELGGRHPTESKMARYNGSPYAGSIVASNDRRQSCISVMTDASAATFKTQNYRNQTPSPPKHNHIQDWREKHMRTPVNGHQRNGRSSRMSNTSRMGAMSPGCLNYRAPSIIVNEECDDAESIFSGFQRPSIEKDTSLHAENKENTPKRISTYVASDHDITKKNVQMRFPEMIPIWQNVTRLYLCKVNLNELPDDFGTLKNLQVLSLEDNRFKEVPYCITKLRSLKNLYLNDNRISRLHPSMRDLVNLRYLWLQKNRLKELSTAICCLANLRYVHLENNMIETISEAIGCMARLKGLWTGFKNDHKIGNKSNVIKTVWSETKNILIDESKFKLSDNCISDLPDRMGSLKNLEILDVEPFSGDKSFITDLSCSYYRTFPQKIVMRFFLWHDAALDYAFLINILLNKTFLTRKFQRNYLRCIPFKIRSLPKLRELLVEGNSPAKKQLATLRTYATTIGRLMAGKKR